MRDGLDHLPEAKRRELAHVVEVATAPFQPVMKRSSRGLENFKLHRPPCFSLNDERAIPDPVTGHQISNPDGSTLEAQLNLHVAHFNIPDPTVPLERRWRIVPTFPDLDKDDVPIDSRVLVSPDVVEAIKGAQTAGR